MCEWLAGLYSSHSYDKLHSKPPRPEPDFNLSERPRIPATPLRISIDVPLPVVEFIKHRRERPINTCLPSTRQEPPRSCHLDQTGETHPRGGKRYGPHAAQMPNDKDSDDDPSSPASRLSSKARLAYFLTGGTRRGPATMAGLLRLSRDRNDVKKAHEGWAAARKEDLDRHQGRWGRSGLAGGLEEVGGLGPKPRGTALVRWVRENDGGGPAREQPPEDDIYGVSDDEQGRRNVKENRGGGGQDGAGEAHPHQQQGGDSGDGQQGHDPDLPTTHQCDD